MKHFAIVSLRIRGALYLLHVCQYLVLFRSYLLVRAPFAWALKGIDRGKPSGHGRGGLGSIHALCRAWRARKALFSAGVGKTMSRVFFLRRYFVPGFFARTYLYIFGNGPACRNSGFPVQEQVWLRGYYHPSLGAFAVCQACMWAVCLISHP